MTEKTATDHFGRAMTGLSIGGMFVATGAGYASHLFHAGYPVLGAAAVIASAGVAYMAGKEAYLHLKADKDPEFAKTLEPKPYVGITEMKILMTERPDLTLNQLSEIRKANPDTGIDQLRHKITEQHPLEVVPM